MGEWHTGPRRPQEQPPLLGLHALALSKHPVAGRRCESCDGPLRYLVIGWTSRGKATAIEQLVYCTTCDEVEETAAWPTTGQSS